jgi:hypothetical protein
MDDLVERLEAQVPQRTPVSVCHLLDEAAAEIRSLRAQVARLDDALAKRIVLHTAAIMDAREASEQVAQERAGIVAYIKRSLNEEYGQFTAEKQETWWYANAIERHEDKEPRA